MGEEPLDEIFELFRGILGESNDSLADDVIELTFGISIIRRTSHVELVEHDAKLVPIYHAIMTSFVDDLKRKVGRCAAERFIERV